MATVGGLLWLRWRQPDKPRPIRVNIRLYTSSKRIPIQLISIYLIQVSLVYPVAFFIVSIFLVCFPVFSSPMEVLTGVGIVLTAVPVFFLCIAWRRKPKWISNMNSIYISFIALDCFKNAYSIFLLHRKLDTVLPEGRLGRSGSIRENVLIHIISLIFLSAIISIHYKVFVINYI